MKVLMLVQSPVAGDSRVLREAAALAQAGHEVHVIGRDVPDGFQAGPGVTVESATRSAGLRVGNAKSPRLARWLLLPEHRRRTERKWRAAVADRLAGSAPYDVVHAHDFNTLELGVELAEEWNSGLVYDSHELWFDRGLPGRPTPIQRVNGRRRETELAGRAGVVLTVSEGIAERFRRRGLTHVQVVRNTFPMAGRVTSPRSGVPTGLVYAGRIGAGRDLETVAAAADRIKPIRTILMGSAEAGYHLESPAVETAEALPIDDVDKVFQEFGIALVTLTGGCDNHRLALPNKLFHAVRAGVPVIAADLPELRAMVTGHRLGALYRPGDASSLVHAVHAVVDGYADYQTGVRAAGNDLYWERDAEKLVAHYTTFDCR